MSQYRQAASRTSGNEGVLAGEAKGEGPRPSTPGFSQRLRHTARATAHEPLTQ